MSFDRIRTNFEVCEKEENNYIYCENLFGMINDIIADVLDYNQADIVKDIKVGDKSLLLKNTYRLLNILLSVYNENCTNLSEEASKQKGKISRIISDIETVEKELSNIQAIVDEKECANEELTRKYQLLENERGHLLKAQQQADELKERIAAITNSKLDEIEAELQKLENDYAQRKEKEQTLLARRNETLNSLNDISTKIADLESNISSINEQIQSAEATKENLIYNKEELEISLTEIKKEIADIRTWIENFPAVKETIEKEYTEEKANETVLINAFTSALSERFIRESLFKVAGASTQLSVDNYPDFNVITTSIESFDDLNTWFNSINERISGLLRVLEKALASLTKKAYELTAKIDKGEKQ